MVIDEMSRFAHELKGMYSEYIFDQIIANMVSRKNTESIWYSIDKGIRDDIKHDAIVIIEQGVNKAYLKAIKLSGTVV